MLAALALASLVTACGGPAAPEPEPRDAPGRIVALAPNLTEIVFALGLGERVVGVSDFATWPPEVRGKPRLGGLLDPNLEGILEIRPDLVLLLPSQEEVAGRLSRLGIVTLVVRIETLEDLEKAILTIAAKCGVADAGLELADRILSELAPRPIPGAPETAIVVDRVPGRTRDLLVAGPGTYFHELLARLGAENTFSDIPVRYPQVNVEAFLVRSPGAVLEVRPEPVSAELRDRLLADWELWGRFENATRGDVQIIAGDWALILGPRLPILYERMEKALRKAAATP